MFCVYVKKLISANENLSDFFLISISILVSATRVQNLPFIWTYCEAVTRNAEILQPSQPVHDAGQVHQETRENLKTQHKLKLKAFFFTARKTQVLLITCGCTDTSNWILN